MVEKLHRDVDVRDESQNTPVMLACSCGNLEITRYLIEIAHADISLVNQWGRGVLHMACANGILDIARYLIETRATPVDSRDIEGNTPLHRASFRGQSVELIQYLLSKGADKRARNNNKESPFDVACKAPNAQTNIYQIKALLQFN